MAKKSGNVNALGLLTFFALIVKALAFILSFFKLGIGSLTFIADIICTGTILLIAWTFVRGCKKGWRIVYFVILGLVIAGFVFGGLSI